MICFAAWGGGSYSWSSAHTVTPLVVGFVTLAAFVLYGEFSNKVNLVLD